MYETENPCTLMNIGVKILPTVCVPLRNVLESFNEILSRLLTLTRFVLGSWHQCIFVKVYDNRKNTIFQRWRYIRKRKIKKFDIIKEKFYKLIANCYSNSTTRLIKEKKLNEAIDWYIESINADTPEFSIINASICLELLTNVLINQKGVEYIIDPKVSGNVRPIIKKEMSRILKNNGINSKSKDKVCGKLNELNRITFNEKIRLLINEYNIDFNIRGKPDYKIIEDIIKIRNTITHQGIYKKSDNNDPEFLDTYLKLVHLIIRIILSQIGYRDSYGLPLEGEKKIEFNEWKRE